MVGIEKAWLLSEAWGLEKRCCGEGRLNAVVVEIRLTSVVGLRCMLASVDEYAWRLPGAAISVVSEVVMIANSEVNRNAGCPASTSHDPSDIAGRDRAHVGR